jgi:predicted acylesterase/phospholipase RssA
VFVGWRLVRLLCVKGTILCDDDDLLTIVLNSDHFGVVKAFLDAKLMPRVITGTSAGGLIAALVCTRTDSELQRLLVPALANKITACEESIRVWFKRFWATGARFDSVLWARKVSDFFGCLQRAPFSDNIN